MKLTFNVLENHTGDKNRHWPGYILGGRIRTSTLVLVIAFLAVWWTYDTYRPPEHPSVPSAPQVVPPGFVPDPNYTWVPRSQVQPPPNYYTPRPTTTVPTTTPPPTTTTTTTTTPPPLFQLPLLPPPFGPGTTTPSTAPPGSTPAPGPIPGLPSLGG